jgi:CheY-like chemotaxis protein
MTNAWAPGNHAVQFYENEPFIHRTIAEFFTQQTGDALILVSRSRTFEAVAERLKSGNYGGAKEASGNIQFIDAEEALSQIIAGETLDTARAETLFTQVLSQARPAHPNGAVRLYGEIVDILCQGGRHATALAFEELASALFGLTPRLSILCGYGMERFRDDPDAALFRAVCRKHSHALPAESFSNVLRDHYRQSALLRQRHSDRMLDSQRNARVRKPVAAVPAGPVYIIEDNAGLRRSLERLMHSYDGAVRTFESAESFFAEVDRLARGCVVVDVELPGMSGLELVERLRRAHAGWPIVVMSGLQDKEVEAEALRRGACVFLRKPFDSRGLFEAIAQALS